MLRRTHTKQLLDTESLHRLYKRGTVCCVTEANDYTSELQDICEVDRAILNAHVHKALRSFPVPIHSWAWNKIPVGCTQTVCWGGILEEIATLIRAGNETRSEGSKPLVVRQLSQCVIQSWFVCMLQSMMKQGYHSGGFIGANYFFK